MAQATKLLAVDPGLSGTGWAFFESGRPAEVGTIRTKCKWPESLTDIAQQLVILVGGIHTHERCIEFPSFMSGTAKSAMVAARGDLVKLTMLAGAIAVALAPATLVPVNTWKGNLSKPLCESRVSRVIGGNGLALSSHEWDAIGIGLYHLFGKEWGYATCRISRNEFHIHRTRGKRRR